MGLPSRTIIGTFGDPGTARTGCGPTGQDSSVVRPIRPGNVVPGAYSRRAMGLVLLLRCRSVGTLCADETPGGDAGRHPPWVIRSGPAHPARGMSGSAGRYTVGETGGPTRDEG
jgi:hypothetical protein